MFSPPGLDTEIRLVQIVDPVGGYQYVIDTVNRIAHRIRVAPIASHSPGMAVVAPSIRDLSRNSLHNETLNHTRPGWGIPQIDTEPLESRSIDGIPVRGVKTTQKYPPRWRGTEGPFTVLTEAWVSDQLKIVVMSKRDDPWSGQWLTRMSEYHAAEPDPDLFRVPPDYAIVDEDGAFNIDIVKPAKVSTRK